MNLSNRYVPTDAESQRARIDKACAAVDQAPPPTGFADPCGPRGVRGAKPEDPDEIELTWLTGPRREAS